MEIWKLDDLLSQVRCGSEDWSWEEEWADLDFREPEYLERLEASIRKWGIQTPVLVGSDGRLWDGHHRLRVAVRLCLAEVPVEVARAQ